jgi:glutathione S-transferase
VPFAEFKPTTPFGQLPVLEVNGKKLAQSRAVERYVAREYGLFGATVVEGALIDMTAEQVRDLQEAFSKTNSVPEAEKRRRQGQVLCRARDQGRLARQAARALQGLPRWRLAHLRRHCLLSVSSMTVSSSPTPPPTRRTSPPRSRRIVKKIAAVPSIAAYLAKRPTRVM